MKKLFYLITLSLILLTSCSKKTETTQKTKNSALSGNLRIAGGTAHLKVMADVAKEIEKANPELKISVNGGGSGVGIKSVVKEWLILVIQAVI